MSDIKSSSVPAGRSYLHSSLPIDNPDEIRQSGYLNRKCVYEAGSKKSKDRQWLTLWCNLKGTTMEFYKVDGVTTKQQVGPPPKEHFPPPNLKQTKCGFADLENTTTVIDYTSQINKELEKRRPYLFQLVLANDTKYIFQAPTEKKRTAWVVAMQSVSRNEPENSMVHSLAPSIKSSRDSIKQKSRQNVYSVRKHTSIPVHGRMGSIDESDYVDLSVAESMIVGDPRMKLLKKHLQAKKEFLKQLKTMYTSYMGGVAAMYVESLIHHEGPSTEPTTPTHSLPAQLLRQVQQSDRKQVPHRRMSLPDSNLLSTVGGEDNRRSSTGDFNVPITTPLSPGGMYVEEVRETELLVDYYLVPGAKWSKLKKGETVKVLGRATNGWYKCLALRDAMVDLDIASSNPLSPGSLSDLSLSIESSVGMTNSLLSVSTLSEMEGGVASIQEEEEELGVAGSEGNRNSSGSGIEVMVSEMGTADIDKESTENSLHESNPVYSTDNPLHPNEEKPVNTPRGSDSDTEREEEVRSGIMRNVGRTKSYRIATEEIDAPFEDVLRKVEDRKVRRKAKTVGRSTSSVTPSTLSSVKLRQSLGIDQQKRRSESYSPGRTSPQPWRLLSLLEKELKNTGTYHAPLIGCIAPSALKCFADSNEGSSSQSSSRPPSTVPTADQNGHMEQEQSTRPLSFQSGISTQESEEDQVTDVTAPCQPDSEHRDSVASETSRGEVESPICVSITLSDDEGTESTTLIDSADPGEIELVEFDKRGDKTSDLKPGEPVVEEFMDRKKRAQSLPPPMISHTPLSSPIHSSGKEGQEVTGTRRGSEQLQEKHASSTTSSPLHSVTSPSKTPPSPSRRGWGNKRGSTDSTSSDLNAKPSFLKKLFARKKPTKTSGLLTNPAPDASHTPSPLTATPLTTSTPGRRNPRPHTVVRKRNPAIQNVIEQDDSFFESSEGRLRVASVSGRPVRREGVGLVIGDSSSESEDEEENEGDPDDNTISPASSYQDESTLGNISDISPVHQLPNPAQYDDNPAHYDDNPAQPGDSPAQSDENRVLRRNFSEAEETNRVTYPGLKRSVSDHDSLSLRAALTEETIDERQELQPKSTTSLRRSFIPKMPSFRKPRSSSEDVVVSPSRRRSKTAKLKTKKRGSSVSDAYKLDPVTPTTPETNTKWDVIFRSPPRGEKRYVYLDSRDGTKSKYGFRLQSYGRVREQGKVLQTFVQSVVPGSVSFLAGLYPGDAIIEVNGELVKYAPVEKVVEAIQVGARSMDRITLLVEFVDGATRLDGMKKADELKSEIKAKQSKLKKILENDLLSSPSPLASPQPITLALDLSPWGEATPTSKLQSRPFLYDKHLNSVVALHQDNITGLDCDVFVIPLSSCNRTTSGNETESVLLHLLRTGGEDMLNELSLAKQCRLGENIVTKGHNLHAKSIYHCVFGTLEESLQRCCSRGLEDASEEGHKTIAFWLDGFASISVPPQIIIESVRQWLQEGTNSTKFDRVVFAAKANLNLIVTLMENTFPLVYHKHRDSIISEQGSVVGSIVEAGNTINLEPQTDSATSVITPLDIVEQEQDTETEEQKPSSEEASREEELKTNETELEDEDELTALPIVNHSSKKTHPPLLERTSVSDIGIQLSLDLDDDEEVSDLNISDSESDELEPDHEKGNPPFSLLECLQRNGSMSTNFSHSITGTVKHTTPTHSRVSDIPSDSRLSSSLPSSGIRLLSTEPRVQRSVSPSHLNRKTLAALILNPERMESDV